MSLNFAIIGAGQLGSRHLQSLAKLARPAKIWVWDPNPSALQRARERWVEAGPASQLAADFTSKLPETVDCAIVATDAASREKAVTDLLKGRKVRYAILEKVLVQDPDRLEPLGALLTQAGAKAWVNCPRRVWPLYKDMAPSGALDLKVNGAGWGLATNAIHFLDLAAFLSKRSDFSVDLSSLSTEAAESKRPGFVEFFGAVRASAGPHHVTLVCDRGPESIEVRVNGERMPEETAPFQSQLTAGVVEDLIAGGTCGLTPYEESAKIHKPFLLALREVWRKKDHLAFGCPIT
jgi:hypothetical protein